MHVHRFALFGLLGSLHAQNPCEPRVQAMYATAGHPPVSCGNAENEQMEVARRWKGTPPAHHRLWRNPKACPRETSFSTLEQLWPTGHFRGPLNGPRSYFKRVPPHFLGYHANFSNCRRKVYVDVGARYFDSKKGFLSMLKFYPPLLDFDEYYGSTHHCTLPSASRSLTGCVMFAGSSLARPRSAFEAVAGLYKLPPHDELVRLLTKQGMHPTRAATFSRRHFFLQAFIGSRSKPETTPPTIGFSDFLETMLGLQPADAVVVKMDVEGYEFDIVQTLLADGTHALIDEIMLEVHYGHPYMMQTYNWCRTPQFWCFYTLENATRMYQSLRDAGVYAHHWP